MTGTGETLDVTRKAGAAGLAVSTHGLVHIYRSEETGGDVAALAGVDLDVLPGEVVALLGPSGAGKSTLLTLFGGLLRASAGRVHVVGGAGREARDLSELSEPEVDAFRATDVGILLQGAERNLVPYYTPRQNVEFAQGAARSAGRALPGAGEVLELVGLVPYANRALTTLTPGQLQLTALAVAVATWPGLLLADEPTSRLDHAARDTVVDALLTVNREIGTTVVTVTHDPAVAARMPRTVTIRDGRIGGEGRSGEEYAVVAPDGSLPLPTEVLDRLPPGTLVRVRWEPYPERAGDGEGPAGPRGQPGAGRWVLLSGEEP